MFYDDIQSVPIARWPLMSIWTLPCNTTMTWLWRDLSYLTEAYLCCFVHFCKCTWLLQRRSVYVGAVSPQVHYIGNAVLLMVICPLALLLLVVFTVYPIYLEKAIQVSSARLSKWEVKLSCKLTCLLTPGLSRGWCWRQHPTKTAHPENSMQQNNSISVGVWGLHHLLFALSSPSSVSSPPAISSCTANTVATSAFLHLISSTIFSGSSKYGWKSKSSGYPGPSQPLHSHVCCWKGS